jgi:hypothetical protein
VAKEDLALATAVVADPLAQALRRLDELLAELVGDLGAALGVVVEIGRHPARRLEAVVGVDQQGADAVLELAPEAMALPGKKPAGLASGRHRVVRCRERDSVQAAIAELAVAVARVDRDQRRVGAVEGERHADEADEQKRHQTGRDDDPQRLPPTRRGGCRHRCVGEDPRREGHPQQLRYADP